MTSAAKTIIEQARKLSAEEREQVLEAMLVSLVKEPAGDVDQAWRELIAERLATIDSEELFDMEETIAELKRI